MVSSLWPRWTVFVLCGCMPQSSWRWRGPPQWPTFHEHITFECRAENWKADDIIPNIAPTAHDDQGTAATNPDFDHLLRGTVHDPTTRRMGGVAGQAGVFSTADDVALFAHALLDRLAGRPSNFPLKRETLQLMTVPHEAVRMNDYAAARLSHSSSPCAGVLDLRAATRRRILALPWQRRQSLSKASGWSSRFPAPLTVELGYFIV
jgi:CubicO group peptidase (beta-lactamase class C family)